MARIIDKLVGETPLEALERFRAEKIQTSEACVTGYTWENVPMTYAGRLDPMAEGKLLILIGDECKDKEKYLGLDKEYEVEILLGISTDTYDALGIVQDAQGVNDAWAYPAQDWLQKYVGKFAQEYPPYSSKTVNGRQLHELARSGALPEVMPTREVEIYSIRAIDTGTITAGGLLARIVGNIDLVKGDFRQEVIGKRWREVLTNFSSNSLRGKNWKDCKENGVSNSLRGKNCKDCKENGVSNSPSSTGGKEGDLPNFPVIRLLVRCSSGTYMRSLAQRIGVDLGTGAFALSINRTAIG